MLTVGQVMHPVYQAKYKYRFNKEQINLALMRREPMTAARLRKANEDLRARILREYGVILE